MTDAAEYVVVAERDRTAAHQIASQTAQKLEARQISLIQVVESVGDYINDEDAKIRGRAVSYLTATLTELPPKYLSRQQLQVLCQFFCDRIEDGGALDGLSHLQSLDRFTTEMTQMTVRAYTSNATTKTRVYKSLALLELGKVFLVSFTDLVSGEKDPRNLMLIFSMLRVTMVEWDIANHSERMFDSVYAYFPITFRPPPNDPYGVTAQDLKDRLRDCIASTKLLAPYAIPNLLDKLDSTSVVVKKDVLRTFIACAMTYDRHTMSQYSITLWDALKFEVLNAQEPEIADETLQTLRAVAICLSKNQTEVPSTSPLAQYLRPIAKECNEHLQEPTNRQAKAAGDILGSLCSANSLTHSYLVKAVFPPFITLYQDFATIPKQRALLEILNKLLDSTITVFGNWNSRDFKPALENVSEKFKDQLLKICSQALMSTIRGEVSFRCTSATSLRKLSTIRGLLQDNEIGLVVQHFDDIVLNEDHYGEDDLRRLAMESLAEVSKYKPRLIMDITFPAFMARLPDTDAEAEANESYVGILEGLAKISVENEPFDTLLRRLLNKIDVLIASENVDSPAYTRAILSTIWFVMERHGTTDVGKTRDHYDRITVGLIRRTLLPRSGAGALTALNHDSVLSVLGHLSNLIIRNLTPEKQNDIAENVYRLFTPELAQDNSFPSRSDIAYHEKIVLSTWILAALPRDSENPLVEASQVQKHLDQLKKLVLFEENPLLRLMLLRQIALYVNKHLKTADLHIATSVLATLYNSIENSIELSKPPSRISILSPLDTNMSSSPFNSPSSFFADTLRLVFTITSALINRLAPSTTTDLSNLLNLLSLPDSSVSVLAAHGFTTLLSPDLILSPQNDYLIRKLVPQRVLSVVLPNIVECIRNNSKSSQTLDAKNEKRKENYLTALSSLLPYLPPPILLPYLDQLFPLLLQCLTSKSDPSAPLSTFVSLLPPAGASLATSGHLPSLVMRLLTLSRPPRPSQVRVLATKTIGMLPIYLKEGAGERELVKEKGKVVRELAGALDDRRRDVRKEAVAARAAWERAVAAEEEEDEEE
ncbi:MAG: hypothetical protein Q9160_005849 [Pyrenula sp. 1 TL-2023]